MILKIVIGAVIGGGLGLAAATHARVAEPSCFYALPEGERGIFVGYPIGQYRDVVVLRWGLLRLILGNSRLPDKMRGDLMAQIASLGGGWMLGTRMLASIGALRGADETNGIMTVVPLDIVVGRKDGLIAIDVGGGGALLSDYKFGRQNFGGAGQFVWTFGVTSRLAGPLGVGYHFQHYSDATLYGQDSRGVDLHLIELIYWFDRRE